jgi:hypothetical protein
MSLKNVSQDDFVAYETNRECGVGGVGTSRHVLSGKEFAAGESDFWNNVYQRHIHITSKKSLPEGIDSHAITLANEFNEARLRQFSLHN